MKTKVISIITEKGGVGKTTTTIHLGAALAEKKKKVQKHHFPNQYFTSLCSPSFFKIPCSTAHFKSLLAVGAEILLKFCK